MFVDIVTDSAMWKSGMVISSRKLFPTFICLNLD